MRSVRPISARPCVPCVNSLFNCIVCPHVIFGMGVIQPSCVRWSVSVPLVLSARPISQRPNVRSAYDSRTDRTLLVTKNYGGAKRALVEAHSSVGGTTVVDIWDSRNRRHVTSELQRYKLATESVMGASQFLSLTPDGSKVGTDFAVTASAVACGTVKKVAIAPPQAHVFELRISPTFCMPLSSSCLVGSRSRELQPHVV